MSDQSRERVPQPARRIGELYRRGGVNEVVRGLRDTALIDLQLPIHKISWNGTIEAGGESVTIRTNTRENYLRAAIEAERSIQTAFVEAIEPGDVVWDIGANIGSYALLAAEAGGQVVAFEPGPQARGDLVANAELNGLDDAINATPYALSDYDGEGMLLPSDRTGTRELRPDANNGDSVPVRAGDSLSVDAPDVVKIDVEGHEAHVIDGMPKALDHARYVLVEVHEHGPEVYKVREALAECAFETNVRDLNRDEDHVLGVDDE